jgi:ribulose-5-phosphate 4-epimerase/fuculose-1-phosphate aldolase
MVSASSSGTELGELIDLGRAVASAGLVMSTSGNVSVRLDRERMAVSGAGSDLAGLTPNDVSIVRIEDGTLFEGPQPSMEAKLHRAIYRVRTAAGAVVHCQSPAATLLACHEDPPVDLDFIPEVPAYVRAHAYVPYAPPGSDALAESVARALEDSDVTVVQLRNHGQVIVASSWRRAVRRGLFFEQACRMALHGSPLRTIPPGEAQALRSYGRDE